MAQREMDTVFGAKEEVTIDVYVNLKIAGWIKRSATQQRRYL